MNHIYILQKLGVPVFFFQKRRYLKSWCLKNQTTHAATKLLRFWFWLNQNSTRNLHYCQGCGSRVQTFSQVRFSFHATLVFFRCLYSGKIKDFIVYVVYLYPWWVSSWKEKQNFLREPITQNIVDCMDLHIIIYIYEQPPLFRKERNSLWMETFFFSNPPCLWERGRG